MLISLWSIQILRCTHFSIDAARRFYSFRDTERTERRGGGQGRSGVGVPPLAAAEQEHRSIEEAVYLPDHRPATTRQLRGDGREGHEDVRPPSTPTDDPDAYIPPSPPPEGLYCAKPMEMGFGNMGWQGRREGSTAVLFRKPPTPLPVSYLSQLLPQH